MTINTIAVAAAIAAFLPIAASAQDEWASRQAAGWTQAGSVSASATAAGAAAPTFTQRAVQIHEGYTPVEGASSPSRSTRMDGPQDGATDMRRAPNPDNVRLYTGG